MPLVLPFAPYYLATTYYSSKFGYLFFFSQMKMFMYKLIYSAFEEKRSNYIRRVPWG